ncbi:zinc-binding protein [Nymphaea thermarum]|nr:zinc-binding protein [Nymphaea thermarum]
MAGPWIVVHLILLNPIYTKSGRLKAGRPTDQGALRRISVVIHSDLIPFMTIAPLSRPIQVPSFPPNSGSGNERMKAGPFLSGLREVKTRPSDGFTTVVTAPASNRNVLVAVPPDIFDKILKKEIPSNAVYEDDMVYAFRDICPQARTHILIIPKVKDGLSQLSKAEERHREILGHLLYTAKVIAKQEGLVDGFRLVINDGPSGIEDKMTNIIAIVNQFNKVVLREGVGRDKLSHIPNIVGTGSLVHGSVQFKEDDSDERSSEVVSKEDLGIGHLYPIAGSISLELDPIVRHVVYLESRLHV